MGAVEDSDDSSVGSDSNGEAITSVGTITDDSVPKDSGDSSEYRISRAVLLNMETDVFQ